MKANNLQEQIATLETLVRVYNSINGRGAVISSSSTENHSITCDCKLCKKQEKVTLLTLSKIEDIINGK